MTLPIIVGFFPIEVVFTQSFRIYGFQHDGVFALALGATEQSEESCTAHYAQPDVRIDAKISIFLTPDLCALKLDSQIKI